MLSSGFCQISSDSEGTDFGRVVRFRVEETDNMLRFLSLVLSFFKSSGLRSSLQEIRPLTVHVLRGYSVVVPVLYVYSLASRVPRGRRRSDSYARRAMAPS
jgi:hypothetical protein